jgi:hypothetical protein
MTIRQFTILSKLCTLTPFMYLEDKKFISRLWYKRCHNQFMILTKQEVAKIYIVKNKYLPHATRVHRERSLTVLNQ